MRARARRLAVTITSRALAPAVPALAPVAIIWLSALAVTAWLATLWTGFAPWCPGKEIALDQLRFTFRFSLSRDF